MRPHQAQLEAIYAAHGRAVLAYAMRRTDSHTAHDVLSETFLVAWRRIDEQPADPLPWLLAIARRVIANSRRGDARRAALSDRIAELHPTHTIDRAVDSGVLEALATLREADQELLLLIGWEGLTPSQAATVAGVPLATITMRLSRARRRFAAALSETDELTPQTEVAHGC